MTQNIAHKLHRTYFPDVLFTLIKLRVVLIEVDILDLLKKFIHVLA